MTSLEGSGSPVDESLLSSSLGLMSSLLLKLEAFDFALCVLASFREEIGDVLARLLAKAFKDPKGALGRGISKREGSARLDGLPFFLFFIFLPTRK